MDEHDIRQSLSKPVAMRLKEIGKGLRVGLVLGKRVLVRAVEPWTEIDEVQSRTNLVIPRHIKRDNTPPPSTGVVVQLGEGLIDEYKIAYGPGRDPYTPWPLQEGTMVLFPKLSGTDYAIGGEQFRILAVEEIVATLEISEGGLDDLVGGGHDDSPE